MPSTTVDLTMTLVRPIFRGVGQVFFQENALTGVLFVLGIAVSSPLMAIGAVVGSAIGTVTARQLKFNEGEISAGIYGFNSTLVGIATFFFFQWSLASAVILAGGGIVATLLTREFRCRWPSIPTYTAPFIVTTWCIYFLGPSLGALRVVPPVEGAPIAPAAVFSVDAIAHGVSQVMFQANFWTAALFLVGIAVSDWRHAAWVLAASAVGMLIGGYHATSASRGLDAERLVERALAENITLGLYGYNATLAAVALYLWRRSLIPPVLGMLLAVLLTEFIPILGLPALTAPFVSAVWLVMALARLDRKFWGEPLTPGT